MPSDLGAFLDGVDPAMFVVTVEHEGQQAGCLVGFATQVSIDPPRLLVCLSVANHTYDIAKSAALLAVHVLGRDQTDLAALFGSVTGDEVDKFAQCDWRAGPGDAPLLSGTAGWLVGSILEQIPFGDHVGFLLDPIETYRDETTAVLTFDQVKGLSPGHAA